MARKKTSDQALRVAKLASAINKKFGAGSALIVSEDIKPMSQMTEFISSGIDVLDNYILARGGYPEGRWSEVAGPEGCGKSALGYRFLAMTQKAGGDAVLIDMERSFDEDRAEVYGVDLDTLMVIQPDHGEQAFQQLEAILRMAGGEVPMGIVFDSLAAAVPMATLDGDKMTDRVGALAALVSSSIRKLNGYLGPARAHIMVINQIRENIGVMFGDKTTTPGGKALKFYASVRIQFFGGKALKDKRTNEHTGKIVTVVAIKNRLTPPFRKVRIRLDYAIGFNNVWSTLEHAKTMKLVVPREDGFKGKAATGEEAYAAALEKLGWSKCAPWIDVDALIAGADEVDDEDAGSDPDPDEDDDD